MSLVATIRTGWVAPVFLLDPSWNPTRLARIRDGDPPQRHGAGVAAMLAPSDTREPHARQFVLCVLLLWLAGNGLRITVAGESNAGLMRNHGTRILSNKNGNCRWVVAVGSDSN